MTRRGIITAGAAALALGGALPSAASATDYCVGAPGCAQADTVATLEQALAKAESQADSDRVLIGPGEYKAQAVTGFSYDRPDGPVEIIGAGRGQTGLTGLAGGSGNVLFLNGGEGTSIHDLAIRIPPNVAADYRGLTLKDAARRIDVIQEPGQTNSPRGVLLVNGGTLSDSTVTMSEWGTVGVAMQNSGPPEPNVIRGSTVAGPNAVYVDGGGRVERSYLIGDTPAVYAKNGRTEIVNSLLRVTDPVGTVVFAAGSPAGTSLSLDGDTLVGTGSPSTTGVRAATGLAPDHDIDVSIRSSIVDAQLPFLTWATQGTGGVRIRAAFSAYNPGNNQFNGNTTADQTDILRGDPGFLDAPGANFHLRPDSALVDAGAPDAAQGIDLDGSPLVIDGNGDGTARRDIGAYELATPAPPPPPQADTQAPVISRFRASRARLSYRLSEGARVTVRIQRRLAGKRARYRSLGKLSASATQGANRTPVSRRIRRKALRPGPYRAVITAIDAAGNRSGPKVAAFRVRRR
jgi:hypothetical protein